MQNIHDLFPRLLELPLFQGISYSEFLEIADRLRLSYIKRKKNTIIAKDGEVCKSLYFVMQGKVATHRESDDHSYTLIEEMASPAVLQPEVLFGLHTRYTHTFVASEAVGLFEIDKSMVRDTLMLYPTFRINYLNILGANVQMRETKLWKNIPEELRLRFRTFMLNRVRRPAGRKQLLITMDDLALQLNTTRLNVSKMLASLEGEGLIEVHRKNIVFPSFELFCNS